ncbi:MAG: hypothetical protein ROZ09_13270 [Thiobacillus sp.]|uniref:hypothetical protein n=1 Tax=Thiobacillus sp. TaxID=924 RepID=UPI0028950160|nr:hypothetical protein [Thiobacillus sp.]MDT3707787.1 hypothetical protein [Thiobacillus sp.]
MEPRELLRRTALSVALASTLMLATTGCMGPAIGPATPDTDWQTDYEDALSPHTQLALGVMQTLKETPELIPPASRSELAHRWEPLAKLIEAKAAPEEINRARREVEVLLDRDLIAQIKDERRTKGDLMGFMMSSGARIPKGGMASLNPDHIAATKTIEALNKTAP